MSMLSCVSSEINVRSFRGTEVRAHAWTRCLSAQSGFWATIAPLFREFDKFGAEFFEVVKLLTVEKNNFGRVA